MSGFPSYGEGGFGPRSEDLKPKQSPWDKLAEQVPFISAAKHKREQARLDAEAELEAKAKQEAERARLIERSDKILAAYYTKKQAVKDDLNQQNAELIAAMDQYREEKAKMARADRALELTERKFNEIMTTPDQLADAVASGEAGISMNEIDYDGQKVPVYELTGFPVRFLQHVVDYRSSDKDVGIGTSRALLQDPSKWVSDPDTMGQRNSRGSDMMTDNISTSYVDANVNLGRNGGVTSKAGVTYGFSRLPGDAIIGLSNSDAGATESAGKLRSQVEGYEDPTEFASRNIGVDNYNEVTIRRYSENGTPLLPDFMIVHDREGDAFFSDRDQLTEATLRHAAYFGIPIVRIHDQAYREKVFDKLATSLENLDENSSYSELYSAVSLIDKSNMFHSAQIPEAVRTFSQDTRQEPVSEDMSFALKQFPEGVREKYGHLVRELEPARRLDYIETALSSGEIPENAIITISNYNGTSDTLGGEQIEINMPGIPPTLIRSDIPEYSHIKASLDQYASRGGSVHDFRTEPS